MEGDCLRKQAATDRFRSPQSPCGTLSDLEWEDEGLQSLAPRKTLMLHLWLHSRTLFRSEEVRVSRSVPSFSQASAKNSESCVCVYTSALNRCTTHCSRESTFLLCKKLGFRQQDVPPYTKRRCKCADTSDKCIGRNSIHLRYCTFAFSWGQVACLCQVLGGARWVDIVFYKGQETATSQSPITVELRDVRVPASHYCQLDDSLVLKI